MFNLSKLKNQDWIITAVTFLLMLIGTILIYSTTFQAEKVEEGAGSLAKQLIFILIGLGIYFFLSIIDYSWLKINKIQFLIYGVIILLLIVVLFTDPRNNARRWIDLGFMTIQPSEFAKLVVILISASIFSSFKEFESVDLPWKTNRKKMSLEDKKPTGLKGLLSRIDSEKFVYKVAFSFLTILPILFLVLIQPALGSTLIIFFIWLILLFLVLIHQVEIIAIGIITLLLALCAGSIISLVPIYDTIGVSFLYYGVDVLLVGILLLSALATFYFLKIKWFYLFTCIFIAFSIFPVYNVVYNKVLNNTQRIRIESFVNPEGKDTGSLWQVRQSKIAIGSGRLWGRGFLQGTQSKLRFLPFAYTDFIFAALAEQFGLVGAFFVLTLFAILIIRIVNIAVNSSDQFGTIVCIGVAAMILLHLFINVGMNLGLLPVTGIPLPLVSYGGSSVLVNLIGLGLVQSVATGGKVVDSSEQLVVLSK